VEVGEVESPSGGGDAARPSSLSFPYQPQLAGRTRGSGCAAVVALTWTSLPYPPRQPRPTVEERGERQDETEGTALLSHSPSPQPQLMEKTRG